MSVRSREGRAAMTSERRTVRSQATTKRSANVRDDEPRNESVSMPSECASGCASEE